MSLAPVVDARYRLHPDDLGGRAHTDTITNVTVQGVETARPVLHFAHLAKPMLLHAGQCDDLAYITGSAVMRDWIGTPVVLDPVGTEDGLDIAIRAPGDPLHTARLRPPQRQTNRRVRAVLLLVLILLISLLVFQLERSDAVWSTLTRILPTN